MKAQTLLVAAIAALIAGAAGYFYAESRHRPAASPPAKAASAPETPAPDPQIAALRKQVSDLTTERDESRAALSAWMEEARIARENGGAPNADVGSVRPLPEVPPTGEDKPPTEIPADAAALKAMRDGAIADMADPDKSSEASQLLAALAAKGDAEAGKALLAILKGDNAQAKEDVVEALDEQGLMGTEQFASAVQALMTDPNPSVRAEVAQALAKMPAEVAGPLVQGMLADPEAKVLRKAAKAIGDMKYAAAANDLIPLTRHADQSVAWEAANALHKMGDATYVEAYVPVYGGKTRSADAKERLEATKQLRKLKLESTRSWLEPLLNDPDPAVVKEAQKAIKDLDKQKK
ncbi:MAG: HEAT repeat domain-containing protein [Planctomycetes bacterium]|nr:HEAT repeat domain-containing protein [Planctomycetota bacterium]